MQESKPPSSAPAPVGHVIECDICHSRASLYLSKADDFNARTIVERHCSNCGATTFWRTNMRRERRVRLKMTACIRFRGVGEELLVTEDVSRGGLCFVSSQHYIEGTKIEVAAPYTAGGMNIFSDYRILAVQKLAKDNLVRYHAMHIGLALAG